MLWHVLFYRAGDSHFSCDLTSNIITQLKEKNILKCFTKTELIILNLEELHTLALHE